MVALSCFVMAGLIWVSVAQFLNLAASLPEYKKNIQEKVAILRSDPTSSLVKAKRTLDEISTEMAKQDAAAGHTGSAQRGAVGSAARTGAIAQFR